jgi:hypothetical protein
MLRASAAAEAQAVGPHYAVPSVVRSIVLRSS